MKTGSLLTYGALGVGAYFLYKNWPVSTAAPVQINTTPTAAVVQTSAPIAPVAPAVLNGASLELRNNLVADWLGSQGKQWDATALASPTLSASDWDAFLTGYNSPGAKTLGGSGQMTADDYVKARLAANIGLSGIMTHARKGNYVRKARFA